MRVDFLAHDPEIVRAIRLPFRHGSGVPEKCTLFPVQSWGELSDRAEKNLFEVAIVQPSSSGKEAHGPDDLPNLARLAERLPPGKVVLILPRPLSTASFLREVGVLGFPIVLVQGMDDDPGSMLRAIARARTYSLAHSASEALRASHDSGLRDQVLDVLAGWPPSKSVEDTSDHFHLHPKALGRRLESGGFPNPGHLIRVGHLLEGLCLARMGIRSMPRIASLLHLGGAPPLSHLAKELTGETFSDLKKTCWEREILAGVFEGLAG